MSATLTRMGVGVLGLLLSAGTCLAQVGESTAEPGYGRPVNVFPATGAIDHLFDFILVLTGVVMVAVLVVLVIFAVRYRHRPGRRAKFIHGNNRLEAVWTLIPTAIMALIAAFSQSTWNNLKGVEVITNLPDAMDVHVIGKQFAWYFHYPGADNVMGQCKPELMKLSSAEPAEIIGLDRASEGGADDLVTTVMYIPVDRKVRLHINSVDVIHSFFLPNFRVKQDALPGLNALAWIEASKTSKQVMGMVDTRAILGRTAEDRKAIADGWISYMAEPDADATKALTDIAVHGASFDDYPLETLKKLPLADLPIELFSGFGKPFDIVCAELCGQGHFKMRGQLFVVSQRQFDAWQAREASWLSTGDDAEGYY